MDTERVKMKCHSCGHITKEKAPKFCSQCGTRLVESIVEAAMPLISGKIKAEAPDLSMPMDVDLDLSSTSTTSMESEVSLLEPEPPPCKLQYGENSVLTAISEKESKISDQPRKGSSNKSKKRKKKTKKLSGAEMESSAPQLRHLSENEQKDIEQLNKIDNETEQSAVGNETGSYSGSNDLINDQNAVCNITNLQVAADDEHPPNSTGIEEVPASCGPVGNLVNLRIVAFQSGITDTNKDGAVQSITESDPLHPNKSNKPASAVNEGSLIMEKLSSRKDGTQSGRGITLDESESTLTSADNKPLHTSDSDSSSSVEENNDQYDMKKEKDILLTQKSRKKKSNNLSAAIQSKEISSALQPKPLYSGNKYDIKESNEVGIEARSYFTSNDLTSDVNSARDIADLQAAVGDKHSPSSTGTVKTLDSRNPIRGQVNTGLAVSKSTIVTAKNMDGAVQSVAESDLYSKNNKSAYVIDDGLPTTEKLSSGKDIELERGDNLGESGAAAAHTDSELLDSADSDLNSSVKEKTNEQHGMTKEEDIPCTKVIILL
ncbi:E3 ubiquitin-protein ligase rnf213-alpha-like [Rhincodon typus]|uniref:E3 ubiquitin-protein ligase rnf213-alpha-like n=1 Tax=Rhincodon typus TaxID=259920 RepID=UPI0020300B19|nr:E3 ubiquitin-protein ligase rnf213-alpha-like [Rhincodon typus]